MKKLARMVILIIAGFVIGVVLAERLTLRALNWATSKR